MIIPLWSSWKGFTKKDADSLKDIQCSQKVWQLTYILLLWGEENQNHKII